MGKVGNVKDGIDSKEGLRSLKKWREFSACEKVGSVGGSVVG